MENLVYCGVGQGKARQIFDLFETFVYGNGVNFFGNIQLIFEQKFFDQFQNFVYGNGRIFGQYTIDWGGHKGWINGSNVPIEALSRMKFEAYAEDDDDDVVVGTVTNEI